LTEARAVLPNLALSAADPSGDRWALEALADWCSRYTPWTAVDPFDGEVTSGGAGLWLDVSGCAHLFGGEEALLADLTARLGDSGLQATTAVADSPGAAWAVARFSTAPVSVVAPGAAEAALAPLPMAGLRLPGAIVEALHAVGLRRIGDVLALPRAPLAARFGAVLPQRLDQALAVAAEPISPRLPVPAMASRLAFAEPIVRAEDLAAATHHLLAELCARLAAAHQGARRLSLRLYRTDATAVVLAVGTSRPQREVRHLERLFREKLAGVDPGFGIDAMVMGALIVEPLAPAQAAMGFAGEAGRDGIARLVDKLGNRIGAERVVVLRERASHLPERACAEVSALAAAAPAPAGAAIAAMPAGERSRQARPVHLLPWPEPIDVIAPVPDGPPVLFRWRRRPHRVAAAEGPERIGAEWWACENGHGHDPDRAPPARDYYRIEDEAGRRFWVYREGGYRAGVRARWFLHGRFA
jgi:protein ImuB